MQTFTTGQLRERLKASTEAGDAEKVAVAADGIDFLEFSDLDKAVEEEVEFVKGHPLILKETEVTGWVYHVESGKVSSGACDPVGFAHLCGSRFDASFSSRGWRRTLNIALNYQWHSDTNRVIIKSASLTRWMIRTEDRVHCSRVAGRGRIPGRNSTFNGGGRETSTCSTVRSP